MGRTTHPVLRIVWTGFISLAAIGIYCVVALILSRTTRFA